MYSTLFHHVLTRLNAEKVHERTLHTLLAAQALHLPSLTHQLNPADAVLQVQVLGHTHPTPLGVAAGFDKNAQVYRALAAFGFGHVEVGSVTAYPQPGNEKPRLFRLPADAAVLNRMGFNNDGSAIVARRLARTRCAWQRQPGQPLVGVNIGKTKRTPDAHIIDDYLTSTTRLAPYADYLVVNVSSPNTPGLRDLQAVQSLRPLLAAVGQQLAQLAAQHSQRPVPLLVKVAPDLADADLDEVAELAVELGLAGIVATNTTICRAGLHTPGEQVSALGAGGISGAPLRERALEVTRRLHARVGGQLCIIGVGGIATAQDAWARLQAGASLIQAYTGMVYGGPLWAHQLNEQLAQRCHREGITSLEQIIGTDS